MSQKGFSIVEVLVATALIGSVVLGVFSLLGPAMKASLASNNMLIASMLAQEGIELVINIRDTNWWQGNDWKKGLGKNGDSPFDKIIGIINYNNLGITYANSFSGCGTINNETEIFNCDKTNLYLNSDNFYNHTSSGNQTSYKRAVKIEQDLANNRLIVTSIVRWGAPDDSSKEVRLVTYLYDWMP